MAVISLAAYAPAGTAAVWLFLALYQIRRERYRTWTEVFLLAASLSVATYAVSDVLFFTAGTMAFAEAAATASLTSLTFAGLFFMLYGLVLQTRFRRALFLALFPVGLLVFLIPRTILTSVTPVTDVGVNWLPDYGNKEWFAVWALVLLTFVLIALWSVYRTFKEVRGHSKPLGRRLLAFIVCFALAIFLSLITNTAATMFDWDVPPLLSTALVGPGIVMIFAISPLADRSLTDILRRWKARDYDIQAAFLLHRDGTLIGSEAVPGQDMIDRDVFGATLDVIQNFMRTSFPALRGKWLQSIRHGDYTVVMERGQYTSVAVVLRGRENDQLRRHMRNLIATFETENDTVLEKWRGTAADAKGLDTLLGELIR